MLFQWSIYYLAYFPLWLSIIFVDAVSLWYHKTDDPYMEISSLILIPVIFVISMFIMKRRLRPVAVGSTKYYMQEAKEEKIGTAEFLATFIFPLFAFDFTTWEGCILFIIFFLAFGYLCIRHNYFCTNIMLDLSGYRIYECQLVDMSDNIIEKKIISRRVLPQFAHDSIYIKGLNNDYSFDCFDRKSINTESC